MTQKTISAAQLRALGACLDQVERFHEIFGAGEVVVTRELCIHHAQEFDWTWAAMYLLTERGRADYEAKHAPLWADYEARRAPLDADYNVKRALLWADCYILE